MPVIDSNEYLAQRFGNLESNGKVTSPPVVIRWDLASGKTTRRLTLPPTSVNGLHDAGEIQGLLKHCKQGGLSTDQFSTNFDPYSICIIDTIAQILLPGTAHSSLEDTIGVVAKIHKLNVSLSQFKL